MILYIVQSCLSRPNNRWLFKVLDTLLNIFPVFSWLLERKQVRYLWAAGSVWTSCCCNLSLALAFPFNYNLNIVQLFGTLIIYLVKNSLTTCMCLELMEKVRKIQVYHHWYYSFKTIISNIMQSGLTRPSFSIINQWLNKTLDTL